MAEWKGPLVALDLRPRSRSLDRDGINYDRWLDLGGALQGIENSVWNPLPKNRDHPELRRLQLKRAMELVGGDVFAGARNGEVRGEIGHKSECLPCVLDASSALPDSTTVDVPPNERVLEAISGDQRNRGSKGDLSLLRPKASRGASASEPLTTEM